MSILKDAFNPVHPHNQSSEQEAIAQVDDSPTTPSSRLAGVRTEPSMTHNSSSSDRPRTGAGYCLGRVAQATSISRNSVTPLPVVQFRPCWGQCPNHAVMSSSVATCPPFSGSGMGWAMELSLK